ncbi:MAG: XdhC family protein [Candidatus Bathyarchaeota archaeon]|nr:MAG: XdhC family protein [Candidatus Bathyarchaeota archaeon]
MSQIIEKANELIARGERFVLVTVVRTEGSVPREVGAKMMVRQDGSILGTIGGGRIEALVIAKAKQVLKEGKTITVTYSLGEEEGVETHMMCGGEMELLLDLIQSRPTLLIVGGGHIALPLSKLGVMLGFRIVVIDDRKEYANKERFPEADTIVCRQFDEAFNEVGITSSTYLVIVTRGHIHDELALKRTIASEAAYIGMIGSRRKVGTIFKNLRESGIPEKAIRRVHAPIGLDIGGETPEEIAVSIMAEIVKIRKGGTGKSLWLRREKKG